LRALDKEKSIIPKINIITTQNRVLARKKDTAMSATNKIIKIIEFILDHLNHDLNTNSSITGARKTVYRINKVDNSKKLTCVIPNFLLTKIIISLNGIKANRLIPKSLIKSLINGFLRSGIYGFSMKLNRVLNINI